MYNNYTSTNEVELSMNSSIAHLSSIAHIFDVMQSKLPENLKALRKSRGWTQQSLADRLGLTRPTLGAYEEGRSEPKLSVLIDIAACFNITVDALVRGSESEWSAERAKGDGLRVLTVSVDAEHDNERVVVVPVKAAAGYAHGYGDPEWVSQLPTFGLPLKELALTEPTDVPNRGGQHAAHPFRQLHLVPVCRRLDECGRVAPTLWSPKTTGWCSSALKTTCPEAAALCCTATTRVCPLRCCG